MTEPKPDDHPLLKLSAEDLDFVTRMVLASGSLKELARHYGVSYPTIRGRLDRLIARLQQHLEDQPPDPVVELLADLVEQGQLTASAARAILAEYRKQTDQAEET